MYKIIATDLDGTLLNADHHLDPFTVATFDKLNAQGLQFIIATGRHYCDVASIRGLLGVPAYLITSNGARVHGPDDALIHARDVPEHVVRRLVAPDTVGAHGRVIVSLFTDKEWFIDRDAPQLLAYHQDSGFTYRVTGDLGALGGAGVAKALYIGDPADLAHVQHSLEREFGDAVLAAAKTHPLDLIGKDTLKQALALLQRATLVLCPDSGPMHVANAVGTPVLGLHAASNPVRSGPYSDRRWCVDRYDAAARKYRRKPADALPWGTKLEHRGVMDLIEVDDVIERLEAFVAARGKAAEAPVPLQR